MALSLIPPVGSPITPRLRAPAAPVDFTFGGRWVPFFVDSGTTALRLALETAACLRPGHAWLPAYGCPDLVAACLAAGVRPALYDVGPDEPFAAPPVSNDVTAVVAAHFLGLRAPLAALRAMLPQGTLLIEDSAQAFPATPEDLAGDLVVLSFGKGKPISLLEGGCLLARPALATAVTAIADRYPAGRLNMLGRWRRLAHDVAIRPSCYGLMSRLPGFEPGRVYYRPAPVPHRVPALAPLAARAAAGYLAETDWRVHQQELRGWIEQYLPAVRDLAAGQLDANTRRLLRYPLLTPDTAAASELLRQMAGRGICATRMYTAALPEISGMPERLDGRWPGAERFAERCVTLPIGPWWHAAGS